MIQEYDDAPIQTVAPKEERSTTKASLKINDVRLAALHQYTGWTVEVSTNRLNAPVLPYFRESLNAAIALMAGTVTIEEGHHRSVGSKQHYSELAGKKRYDPVWLSKLIRLDTAKNQCHLLFKGEHYYVPYPGSIVPVSVLNNVDDAASSLKPKSFGLGLRGELCGCGSVQNEWDSFHDYLVYCQLQSLQPYVTVECKGKMSEFHAYNIKMYNPATIGENDIVYCNTAAVAASITKGRVFVRHRARDGEYFVGLSGVYSVGAYSNATLPFKADFIGKFNLAGLLFAAIVSYIPINSQASEYYAKVKQGKSKTPKFSPTTLLENFRLATETDEGGKVPAPPPDNYTAASYKYVCDDHESYVLKAVKKDKGKMSDCMSTQIIEPQPITFDGTECAEHTCSTAKYNNKRCYCNKITCFQCQLELYLTPEKFKAITFIPKPQVPKEEPVEVDFDADSDEQEKEEEPETDFDKEDDEDDSSSVPPTPAPSTLPKKPQETPAPPVKPVIAEKKPSAIDAPSVSKTPTKTIEKSTTSGGSSKTPSKNEKPSDKSTTSGETPLVEVGVIRDKEEVYREYPGAYRTMINSIPDLKIGYGRVLGDKDGTSCVYAIGKTSASIAYMSSADSNYEDTMCLPYGRYSPFITAPFYQFKDTNEKGKVVLGSASGKIKIYGYDYKYTTMTDMLTDFHRILWIGRQVLDNTNYDPVVYHKNERGSLTYLFEPEHITEGYYVVCPARSGIGIIMKVWTNRKKVAVVGQSTAISDSGKSNTPCVDIVKLMIKWACQAQCGVLNG